MTPSRRYARTPILGLILALAILNEMCHAAQPTCLYEVITPVPFNPWDRWNVYTGNSLSAADTVFQGRIACGEHMVPSHSEINTVPQLYEKTPWAMTFGSSGYLYGTNVYNGGVEADVSPKFSLDTATVHGDLLSTSGVEFTDATVDGTVKYATDVKVEKGPIPKKTEKVTGAKLSVDLDSVTNYFTALSAHYAGMTTNVDNWENTADPSVLNVKLHRRVNVLSEIAAADFHLIKKIVLSGVSNAALILNLKGDVDADFPLIEVVHTGPLGNVFTPTFNRLLLHFPDLNGYMFFGPDPYGFGKAHLRTQGKDDTTGNATTARVGKDRSAIMLGDPAPMPVFDFSIFAPPTKGHIGIGGCVLKGNVVGGEVGFNKMEVHTQPWGRPAAPKRAAGQTPKPRTPLPPGFVPAKCLWGEV